MLRIPRNSRLPAEILLIEIGRYFTGTSNLVMCGRGLRAAVVTTSWIVKVVSAKLVYSFLFCACTMLTHSAVKGKIVRTFFMFLN